MKLTVLARLKPTPEQAASLEATLVRCNEACTAMAAHGFAAKSFRQFDLHKLAYAETRARFDLAAQVTVRCIAKVADAFKINRNKSPVFRRLAAQPYDDRILSFKGCDVSIWTLAGRIKMPFVLGDKQRKALAFRKGESDLITRKGKWFLAITCDIPETEEFHPTEWLGVDFGLANIAFDSDGNAQGSR